MLVLCIFDVASLMEIFCSFFALQFHLLCWSLEADIIGMYLIFSFLSYLEAVFTFFGLLQFGRLLL